MVHEKYWREGPELKVVAILAVQAIPKRRLTASKIRGAFDRVVELAAIHEEDIEKPVVVVVKQRHAAAHRLDQILLLRG